MSLFLVMLSLTTLFKPQYTYHHLIYCIFYLFTLLTFCAPLPSEGKLLKGMEYYQLVHCCVLSA